jgi:chemotaxis protein CheX
MNAHIAKVSEPLIANLKDVFRRMVGLELSMQPPRLKLDRLARGDLTSLIPVSGAVTRDGQSVPFSGLLMLSFSESVYLAIATRMLGEVHTTVTDEIADVGSEIVNIVLGKSKPALSELGMQLSMTSPSTVIGKDHHISLPELAQTVEVLVGSEVGAFYLEISYVE